MPKLSKDLLSEASIKKMTFKTAWQRHQDRNKEVGRPVHPIPDVGQVEVFDRDCRGLALRISSTGSKSYVFSCRFNKQRRRITIGSIHSLTLAEAREEVQALRRDIAKGIDPRDAVKKAAKAADRLNVSTVAGEFLERHAKQNRSWKDTEGILRLYVKPAWGQKSIADVTKEDVSKLLNRIQSGSSVYRRNRALACIRKMFNWAVANYDEMTTSPVVKGMAAKGEEARDRYLTPDEIRLVWRAADRIGYPFGPLFQFLLVTGQRRGEVLNLRRGKNLDLEVERLWTLTPEETKAKREHWVPLSDLSLQVLGGCTQVGNSPYVFSSGREKHTDDRDEGPRPVSGLSKVKDRINAAISDLMREDAEGAGLDPESVDPMPDWRPHDFRRTVATHLEETLGFAPHEVGIFVLNHDPKSYKGVTAVYTRGKHLLKRRRLQNAWARYVRLVIDAEAWAKVSEHLRPRDAEGDEAAEIRAEEFQIAIQSGGEFWDRYLEAIVTDAPRENVVPLTA